MVLFNANIPVYEPARVNHEPKRPRELLVKARERNRLLGLIRRDGVTLIPLVLYFNVRAAPNCCLVLPRGDANMTSVRLKRTVAGNATRRVCCVVGTPETLEASESGNRAAQCRRKAHGAPGGF